MAVEMTLKLERDVISQTAIQAGEPAWMLEHRLAAWEAYERLPLPIWEKSDISKRKWTEFSPKMVKPLDSETMTRLNDLPTGLAPINDEQQPFIFLQDGFAVRSQGAETLPEGVIFTDLATAVREHGSLVQKHFGSVVAFDEHKFLALHTALWRGGVFVYVPRNVAVDVPLQALYAATEVGEGVFPHVLIVAEAGSSVTYVDGYFSTGELKNQLHSSVFEVVVGANATVKVNSIQNFHRSVTNVVTRRAKVMRDGRVEWVFGELSDGFTVGDYKSVLEEQGARGESKTIVVGTGRQHFDMTSSMIHVGRNTDSDMVTRGVMLGRSVGIYRAGTQIEDGAIAASGEQEEKLLMLSPHCRADAIPMLIINENEVNRFGHAASVGQINPDHMYYLQSRGISEMEAKRLIVWGFLDPVLDQIPLEGVRDAVKSLIERKMI